jgi:hypothetical protein
MQHWTKDMKFSLRIAISLFSFEASEPVQACNLVATAAAEDPHATMVRMWPVGARQAVAAAPLLRWGRRAGPVAWLQRTWFWCGDHLCPRQPRMSLERAPLFRCLAVEDLEHLCQVQVEVISFSPSLMVLFRLVWLLHILVICVHYVWSCQISWID